MKNKNENRNQNHSVLLDWLKVFRQPDTNIDLALSNLREMPKQEILEAAQSLLKNPDPSTRQDIAELLLRFNAQECLKLVFPLLHDQDEKVRYYVTGLLHDFGDERAIEALIPVVLYDSSNDVRSVACYTLGKIGNPSLIPILEQVHKNDQGLDRDGDPVSFIAKQAINEILQRYNK